MTDLVAFLTARLDEDEALVTAPAKNRPHPLANRWQNIEMEYRPTYAMLIGGPTPHRLVCQRAHEINILAEHLSPELAAFLSARP